MIFGHLWETAETRELFGDEGRTRIWLSVLRRARVGAGRAGAHPAGGRHRDRGAGAAAGRPRGGGGGDAAQRPLDARADPRAPARPRRAGARVGLVRRHGAGRLRHVDRDRHAADAGDRRARPRGDRGLARRARPPPSRRRHARPHARPARAADHVRLQGVACGWRRCAVTASGSPRRGRGWRSGSSPARSGRCRRGVAPGLELQRRVLERLGLGAPDTSWTNARDRVAELVGLLALVTATLAKIGNEVYNLQRPEIGELSEAPTEGVVGSITMPQKRNPERSEHLSTLARVVRAAAGPALEAHGGRARARRRRVEDGVGAAAAGVRRRGRRPGARRPSWPPACGSTSSGCARTSTPSAATSSPSRRCSRSEPRSARAGRTSSSRPPPRAASSPPRRSARRSRPIRRSPRCSRRSGSKRCCTRSTRSARPTSSSGGCSR